MNSKELQPYKYMFPCPLTSPPIQAATKNWAKFQVLYSTSLSPLDIFPEVKLIDYMAVLFLNYGGSFITFCVMPVPIYNPTNSVQVFPFTLIFDSIFYFLSFLMIGIVTLLRWNLTVILICIYLMISDAEHISYTCWLSICLLWKMSIEALCPFLTGVLSFCY